MPLIVATQPCAQNPAIRGSSNPPQKGWPRLQAADVSGANAAVNSGRLPTPTLAKIALM
jgi:hypothetical protein